MNYQLPEVYEPKNAADLRRHYAAVFKRNRPETQRPIVVIKPLSVVPTKTTYTYDQAREFMVMAHAMLNGFETPLLEIMAASAEAGGISISAIKADRRFRRIVTARHVYFYLARLHTTKSLPSIGRMVGGRDHSTVMNGIENVEKALAANREPFTSMVAHATDILKGKRS